MAEYKWQNIIKRIKTVNSPVGAEVGVYRGELSIRLLENIPDLTLYLIDAWSDDVYSGKSDESASLQMREDCEKNYLKNYNYVKRITAPYRKRTIIIKDKSLTVAKNCKNKFFDFIFIDADHSYDGVINDIKAWLPKVKENGWLCGHDYNNPLFPDVKKAVDELIKNVAVDSDYTWFYKVKGMAK